jgi:regulation of enolase protein 1 (concanavalin A-like superfamily)
MEWLNEPANWQRTGDLVTVSVDTGTDFWRETGYGYVRDSGHVYGEVLAGDLDVSVRVHCTLGVQYDQAGVMLRADERTWLKTGMEFFEGRPRLSTVLTLGRSSWMVTDLPVGTDTIVLRVSRRGDAVEVRYVLGDAQPELAALVFLPPGREVLAGVMGAAPEGPGFTVTFQDLRISESDWSAPADAAMTWQDDQPDWAGSDAPGWSQPEGEPGWAAPEVREEATDWSGEAGDDGSSWPLPAAAEDGPGRAAEEAGEGETDWPAPADVADEPGWAAPAPDDAGQAPWPDLLPAAEPSPDEPAVRGDVAPGDAGPGPAAPEPADRVPGAEPAGGEPLASPGPEASNRGTSSAGPAGWPPGGDRAAAADWDLLAAGAQAEPAESWIAQSDADVAHEWPGPPLRREAGTGPSASGVTLRPAVDDSADDAQTDPGLTTARAAGDAATLPDQAEAGTEPDPPAVAGEGAAEDSAAGVGTADDGTGEDGIATDAAANDAAEDGTANDGTAEDGAAQAGAAEDGTAEDGAAKAGAAEGSAAEAGAAEGSAAKDKLSGREARRARSKRAAEEPPTEPDAADEWISLLTADPVEE